LTGFEEAGGKPMAWADSFLPLTQTTLKFMQANDHTVLERVRIMDNQGFTQPVEAISLLLPQGWRHQGEVVWIMPGQPCAGNNMWFSAASPDNRFALDFLPNILLNWSSDQEMMQFNMMAGGQSPYCGFGPPVDAEHYFRNMFMNELGHPQVIKMEPNHEVVRELQAMAERSRMELMQYGAADVRSYPSAINAEVQWGDGTEGFVLLCSVVGETVIPNMYTGGFSTSHTTMITKRTVFRYPAAEKEDAKRLFSAIMASIRNNPAHGTAVNDFWRQVRQQSNRIHWDKIRLMDEQTRQMGERAVQQGNQRLKEMDKQARVWETTQQPSSDRSHKEFIKAIREVENFRDESGTYEVAAGYDHVWSRGDGSSFVLSNNPNFDAAATFQDQAWKQMRKVD
jgi:hypothetical protein